LNPFGVELQQAAYALDSHTIDLCLSLLPWAKFRRHKAVIKLHTLRTLRSGFPTVVILTPGKVHDVNILDDPKDDSLYGRLADGHNCIQTTSKRRLATPVLHRSSPVCFPTKKCCGYQSCPSKNKK
jgi:hypothetical protein